MITQTKKFYYVEAKKEHLRVTLEDFSDGPLPLVWNNQGLYSIIRIETINSMIEQLSDHASLPVLEMNKNAGVIHWDDALPHHHNDMNRILKLLLSKQTH